MILTEIIIKEMEMQELLKLLPEYIGKEQTNMILETIHANELKEEDIRNLINEWVNN